jgi:hypothetical protein
MELQELADDYSKYKNMKSEAERQLKVIEPKLLELLKEPVNNSDNSYTVKKVQKEGNWTYTADTIAYIKGLPIDELEPFIKPTATSIKANLSKGNATHLLTTGYFPVSDKLELEGL